MTHEATGNDVGAPRRIGVLGAAGQLGRCLVREIAEATDLELAFAATREDFDLSERDRVGSWLDAQAVRPDIVVNAAAFTQVDTSESEAEVAYAINAVAPGEWARVLAARQIRFIHISTDYVFRGDGTRPYRETDPTEPRTVYGSSKRAGEIAVLGTDPSALVVRTSWVFGPGRNFVVAILDQAAKRRRGQAEGPLRVVDDQQGSPTSAADLALGILALCRLERAESGSGLLHLCNAGVTTWYGFAREILDQAGYGDIEIDPVPTSTFKTAATRPAYSVLDCRRAAQLGVVMRDWKEALAGYLEGPDRPESVLPSDSEPRVPGRAATPADASAAPEVLG